MYSTFLVARCRFGGREHIDLCINTSFYLSLTSRTSRQVFSKSRPSWCRARHRVHPPLPQRPVYTCTASDRVLHDSERVPHHLCKLSVRCHTAPGCSFGIHRAAYSRRSPADSATPLSTPSLAGQDRHSISPFSRRMYQSEMNAHRRFADDIIGGGTDCRPHAPSRPRTSAGLVSLLDAGMGPPFVASRGLWGPRLWSPSRVVAFRLVLVSRSHYSNQPRCLKPWQPVFRPQDPRTTPAVLALAD